MKKTPEEIEREIKAQEAELQKLLQVEKKLKTQRFIGREINSYNARKIDSLV